MCVCVSEFVRPSQIWCTWFHFRVGGYHRYYLHRRAEQDPLRLRSFPFHVHARAHTRAHANSCRTVFFESCQGAM